jgi:hypothetical protein
MNGAEAMALTSITAKILRSMIEMTEDESFRRGVGVPDEVPTEHIDSFFTGVQCGIDLARALIIEMGKAKGEGNE